MNRPELLAWLVLALVAFAPAAHAHTRSQSHSSWTIEGDAVAVLVEADALDVTRLYALGGEAPLPETFRAEVDGAFEVAADGRACVRVGETETRLQTGGRISALLRFGCPSGALARGTIEVESRLFLRVAPSHLHFVALRDDAGGAAEAVLTESRPRAELSPAPALQSDTFWSAAGRFLIVGAEHVASGLDHIAFMIALVLLVGGRLRAAVVTATGFTLGHSATLGLAATGVLRPDVSTIEALIGFTIAFVALGVGAGGRDRLKAWSTPIAAALAIGGIAAMMKLAPMAPIVWFGMAAFVFAYPRGFPRDAGWIAAMFGLIHGCGFASALTELDLPQPRLLASLLGFNLGVEAAQIVVIGAAIAVGMAARRLPETLHAPSLAVCGAGLFGLGAYWFIERLAA